MNDNEKNRVTRLNVAKLVDGDPEIFRLLVRQYGPAVRAWLAGHVSEAQVVNDLTQETFIAAWEGLSRYDDDGKLGGWLIGIARNRLRMHYRSLSRRDSAMARYQENLVALLGGDGGESNSERLATLAGCLNKLPERSARVVRERYVAGASVREIAKRVDMTGNAVTQLLFRTRQQLQTCVKQEGAW